MTFDVSTTTITIPYEYKANISVLRIKNIASYSFTINSVGVAEIVMVSPGDTLAVTIVKSGGGIAILTLQEKLIY